MASAKFVKLFATIALPLALSAPAVALPPLSQPAWGELSVEQRNALAPLAKEWNTLEDYRKMKWLGIARRFDSMTSEEKYRVHERMKEWAKLTPAERKAVRDSFVSIQKAPPEHRGAMKESITQKWKEYSELSEEEKKKFRPSENGKPANPR